MSTTITPNFQSLTLSKGGTFVFLVAEDAPLSGLLAQINDEHDNVVSKAFKAQKFTGKAGKNAIITGGIGDIDRIVVIGFGGKGDDAESNMDESAVQGLGATVWVTLENMGIESASVVIEDQIGGFTESFVAANLAFGAKLRSYRFDDYFTTKKEDELRQLQSLTFLLKAYKDAVKSFESYNGVANGVAFARDVVTEPANIIYPESYAKLCKDKFKEVGVKVEVLGEKELTKLGMNALLGVGQGSARESQVVVMTYNNATDKKEAPVAFVGKGVTFDTGGISIKPSARMEEMKYDMGGSAAVVGAMYALAARKAKVNAIGVIGLVENMPDGNAQRPGDVVTSMSGQTIEVINTDAEGRLVLADILWYTQDKFKPKFMINLATLTGAIVMALADQNAGIFSNSDELAERLTEAGKKVKETVWRLPLSDEYDKMINSKIADMMNVGDGRGAGSITAAQFLQRFVNDTPWTHIDIAGMAWNKKARHVSPEGSAGFGVRLLDRLVKEYYES